MLTLLETIAKAIVKNPDEVKIRLVPGNKTDVIELAVAKSDLNAVIGMNGIMADAIRTIINQAAFIYKKKFVLNIIEKEDE